MAQADAAEELQDKKARFISFHYLELKDLTKQLLTLIAGTLVLTISFSDKILPLDTATTAQRILLGSCWICLLLAFVLAGIGLALLFFAVAAAAEGSVRGKPYQYSFLAKCSYLSIDAAGTLFALALIGLGATGVTRLLT